MKKDFTAFFMLAFTVFVVIACFLCLSPVFASLHTALVFLCQFIAFKIVWSLMIDIYNYIKERIGEIQKDKQ